MSGRWLLGASLLVPILAGAAVGGLRLQAGVFPNPPYTGEFVFTRIRYGPPGGGGFGGGFGGGGARWSHDYPDGDRSLSTMLRELTRVRASTAGTNTFTLDDPELFRNPIAYISEPGFWGMSEAEAEGLRRYVQKGGFLIFDDFELEQWRNFEAQLRRVIPDAEFFEIGPDHPIFNVFFYINEIYFRHPLVPVTPSYHAVFEDNDANRRMIAIINYNNDLAEFWEWSHTGLFAINDTNEAYKLGMNYIIWGLTH